MTHPQGNGAEETQIVQYDGEGMCQEGEDGWMRRD